MELEIRAGHKSLPSPPSACRAEDLWQPCPFTPYPSPEPGAHSPSSRAGAGDGLGPASVPVFPWGPDMQTLGSSQVESECAPVLGNPLSPGLALTLREYLSFFWKLLFLPVLPLCATHRE